MKVGSLFSGIGGLDLGLERAGMEIIWQVENDRYCQAVLKTHWPQVKQYGDIRDIQWANVNSVDLVCGGFPCQPVSVAGKRLGQRDPRWLWPEFARCVREVRPKYVLVENVPGLLVRGMGDVLGDLAACGYDAEWDCLPAAVFGAPHYRPRVFTVAYPKEFGDNRRGRIWRTSESPKNGDASYWRSTPEPQRMAHGLPNTLDRNRVLGNAVVPQVAEWIGRRIVAMNGDA